MTNIEALQWCRCDFNDDGNVDGVDLTLFAKDFGRTNCRYTGCNGDFDLDGDVDGADLSVFACWYGTTGCKSKQINYELIEKCKGGDDENFRP